LGIGDYTGFSSTMWTLLPLFLVPNLGHLNFWEKIPRRWAFAAGLAFVLVLSVPAFLGWTQSRSVMWWVWLFLPVFLAVVIGMTGGKTGGPWTRGQPHPPAFAAFKTKSALLLLPLLVLINGASPFLGFKTETSFAMYSNLRTEGGQSNHLLWKRPLALAPYQTDLVDVMFSNVPQVNKLKRQEHVPRILVQMLVFKYSNQSPHRPIWLNIRESDGRVVQTRNALEELSWLSEPSFLERKLLRFRVIPPMGLNACYH
jgi:hypothetical protein